MAAILRCSLMVRVLRVRLAVHHDNTRFDKTGESVDMAVGAGQGGISN